LALKRRIDASNQERTDMVDILMVILKKYSDVKVKIMRKSTQKVLLGLLTGYRY
jgi:uncharacterized protein YjfI (DUF2170 family)